VLLLNRNYKKVAAAGFEFLHSGNASLNKSESKHSKERKNGHDSPLLTGIAGDSYHPSGSSEKQRHIWYHDRKVVSEINCWIPVYEELNDYKHDHQYYP
jgi:hypothetical protein